MLILTRRRNERIIINDNTIVTVKRIFGNRVTVTVEQCKEGLEKPPEDIKKKNKFWIWNLF